MFSNLCPSCGNELDLEVSTEDSVVECPKCNYKSLDLSIGECTWCDFCPDENQYHNILTEHNMYADSEHTTEIDVLIDNNYYLCCDRPAQGNKSCKYCKDEALPTFKQIIKSGDPFNLQDKLNSVLSEGMLYNHLYSIYDKDDYEDPMQGSYDAYGYDIDYLPYYKDSSYLVSEGNVTCHGCKHILKESCLPLRTKMRDYLYRKGDDNSYEDDNAIERCSLYQEEEEI